MKNMKLFPKTFLYTLALLCVMIGISYASLYAFLPVVYANDMERDLLQKSETLTDMVRDVSFDSAKEIIKSYAEHNNINIVLRTADAEEYYQGFYLHIEYEDGAGGEEAADGYEVTDIYDTGSDEVGGQTSGGEREEGDAAHTMPGQTEEMADMETILVQQARAVSCDGTVMNLQLMMNTQPIGQTKEVMKMLLPLVLGISLLFSLLFSYVCSRRITRPMIQMVEKTRDMEQLKEDAYFDVTGGDEIAILAKQINGVYAQLWEKIDALEKENKYISEMERAKVDFLRAASHELKTPLASLRILLENMQYNVGKYKDHEKYLASCVETVDRLTDMVQEILAATRLNEKYLETGREEHPPRGELRGERELISVPEEVEAVCKEYEVLAKAKELALALELEPGMRVDMNRDMFRKVCSNLIGNAVRYTDQGGFIRVMGSGRELVIENTCKPIPQEQLSHIFEPFYRPEFERSRETGGNGLGLYIVKEILEANEAEYRFEPFQEGMRFVIKFAAV